MESEGIKRYHKKGEAGPAGKTANLLARGEARMDYYFRAPVKSERLQGHLKMGGRSAAGDEIGANSLYFTRNGAPWIGVMGSITSAGTRGKTGAGSC